MTVNKMTTLTNRLILTVWIILGYAGHVTSVNSIDQCSIKDSTLDCSNRNLTFVPDLRELPESITYLDFSQNRIKNVILNISHPNFVTGISFAHNTIDRFEHQVYQNMEELLQLDLSYNNIKLSADDQLHTTLFKLKHITLQGNALGEVDDNFFSMVELSDLEYLDLSSCSLRKVEELSFSNLLRLRFLNLSHNILTNFEFSIGEIEVIDLSFNKIQYLQQLRASVSLKSLFLDYNGMETIKDGVFNSLLGIEVLSLVGNNLHVLGPNTLPISSIGVELQELRLDKNPWHCDCDMRWLVTKQENERFTNFSLLCVYPSRLRGKNVFDVPENDLKCSYEYSRLIFILIMFFSAAFMVAAVGYLIYFKRHYFKLSKDKGGEYVAVYTNDDRDENTCVKITTADDQCLVDNEEREQSLVEQARNGKVHYFDV